MTNGDETLSQAHLVVTVFVHDFVPVTDKHSGLLLNE